MTDSQTFYRERANGRWEYWTYDEDGQRYYVGSRAYDSGSHPRCVKPQDKLVTVTA